MTGNNGLENGLRGHQSVNTDKAIQTLVLKVAQIIRYEDRVNLVGANDSDLVHELELYAIARDLCVRSYGLSPHGFDAAVRANVPKQYYHLID